MGGLGPGAPVLEIGCGTGQLTRSLLARGLRVTAVEPGERLIARARDQVQLPGPLCERATNRLHHRHTDSRSGTTPTLTFTLGTPSGAVLGSPTTNTLTIVEPSPSVTTSTASLGINAPSVVIRGIFNPVAANNTVTFNDGAVGTVTSASATTLTVTFTTPPTGLGSLTATVTSAGLSTGAPVQVATLVPVVSTAMGVIGLNATTFAINGFGFDPIAANNTVILSNGAIGTVTSATPTQLTVTLTKLPTGTGLLTAVVTTDGQTSGVPVAVGVVGPVVQFATASENAGPGVFNIAVSLAGNPSFDSGAAGTVSTFATNTRWPQGQIAFDSHGNLFTVDYEENL